MVWNRTKVIHFQRDQVTGIFRAGPEKPKKKKNEPGKKDSLSGSPNEFHSPDV